MRNEHEDANNRPSIVRRVEGFSRADYVDTLR